MIHETWARKATDYQMVRKFLAEAGLDFEEQSSNTLLLFDDEHLVGTGSLDEGVLKCIAVQQGRQGEGLLGSILTSLIKKALEKGYHHLFVYTKPQNEILFKPFGFYTIVRTTSVLLMENKKNGIQNFVKSLKGSRSGVVGSIVMNANPFTLGHRYLVEEALKQVDELQVFVLASAKSIVPPEVRFMLVQQGCADLDRVYVQKSSNYMVSSATFPTYFLPKDHVAKANAALDIRIFIDYFVPELHITKRFLGTEPLSPITNSYNEELLEMLPKEGIEVQVLDRKENEGEVISASRVRALMKQGNLDLVKSLVPPTTYSYLSSEEGRRLFQTENT